MKEKDRCAFIQAVIGTTETAELRVPGCWELRLHIHIRDLHVSLCVRVF